ncbi:right-handed parallel beta-helix repeat-containing protein [bacterium]|nr:right-handed parallel beta-helix repeat-containing protein [bacterium]
MGVNAKITIVLLSIIICFTIIGCKSSSFSSLDLDSSEIAESLPPEDGANTNGSAMPPASTDPDENPSASAVAEEYNVPDCYLAADSDCENTNPYENPACFKKFVEDTIVSEEGENTNYYVAITQEEYAQQGGVGCPYSLQTLTGETLSSCPWGNDDNDGLSVASPLATFKMAFEKMNLHKKNGTKKGTYTLNIRGGKYSYSEPIVMVGYVPSLGGVGYKGPLWYDDAGNTIKGSSGDYDTLYYSGDEGYDTANRWFITGVHVKPYNNETVTLDGGCEFTPTIGSDGLEVVPGHSEWNGDDIEMIRTCSSSRWGDPTTDAYTAGFFNTMGMVYLSYARNIIIEGLNIKNSPAFGIVVYGASKDIIIRNNSIANTGSSGINLQFGPKRVLVENNDVSFSCARSMQENISAKNSVSHIAIINNNVHDTYNDAGICIAASNVYVGHNKLDRIHTGAIYLTPESTGNENVWVNSNMIHDNTYGDCIRIASEMRGAWENVAVTNNICDNTVRGIWIAGYFHLLGDAAHLDPAVDGVPMNNIRVLNNTVYNMGSDEVGYGVGFEMTNPAATNVYVANNIFSKAYSHTTMFQYVFSDEAKTIIDENIIKFENNITYCDNSTDLDEEGNLACLTDKPSKFPGELSLQKDPLFVDPENDDFRLAEGSPARDAGLYVADSPQYDFECDLRNYKTNTTIDIGADERY